MATLTVFGAQWGDEGKGKIIDRLARNTDVIVRYQGGANAGHTVVVGDEKFVLHLLPSGILTEGKLNLIGNGVAIDPEVFLHELEDLAKRGIHVGPERLVVSASAHVILETHKVLDNHAERWRGAGRIGTTGRGIGPAYADKASRTGLRICDLVDPGRLRSRLTAFMAEKNALLQHVHGAEPIDTDALFERYNAIGARVKPFVGDTGSLARRAHKEGKNLLFEGAQGAMLDVDHGTYPYVTSSNTGVGGIGPGAGFPPQAIDRALGIAKAYCTRVGEGPFPSELEGAEGERLRELGNEYGATTGRPRRCGWFDAVAMRYALAFNGATGLVMTNLDVLSGFDEVQVATSYNVPSLGLSGLTEYPGDLPDLSLVEVVLESHPGWKADITGVRKYEDLPADTRHYVEWVEALIECPIQMLSVGPERDQVILRSEF